MSIRSVNSIRNVIQELNRFTNSELSAFYFESIKRQLYADDKLSLARRSAQTAVYHDDRWHNTALEQDWTVLRHLRSQYYQLVEKVRQVNITKHYEWCIWSNDSTFIGTT
ncbi:hypothetical protein BDF22DRAFT_654721 [Syncephalis plumigaleata]|nr:hypothetical protein BDF22DRAFT_654721 [Syncephalis plumigaleata]